MERTPMTRLGVCYYPEHWPEAMWSDDAARMKALGLSLVRIGEFAWAKIEPEPGLYDWGWLDRAIETLASAGLEVILGTPTATPPKWLIDAHPDILPHDAHGRPRRFGSRRHYSFSSKTYWRESARIVEAMAERYARHPAITLWQTDNEYGCHDTVESFDPDAAAAFRVWLAGRYGSVTDLNEAWGTVFWSQTYRLFEEVDPPGATVTDPNPAHVMDWRRFSSDQVARYNHMQIEILRRHAPGVDITHNFMGHFTEFDHYPLGEQINVATWDSYPLGFLEQAWWDDTVKQRYARSGHPDFAAFHHDLYRGVSKGRFGVMEQQPGPVNWARYNPAPQPGMVALWTLEAAAHGAEMVSYFRWRQAPFAQEQNHAGLNRVDNAPDVASEEARIAGEALQRLGPLMATTKAHVALVYDYEAHWACETQPQGKSFRHDELTFLAYTACRRLGLNVDIVGPEGDLTDYAIVILPGLVQLRKGLVARLEASGAHILALARTGSRTASFHVPKTLPPGELQTLIPVKVVRSESLRPGVVEPAGPYRVSRWLEHVESPLEPDLSTDRGQGLVWQNGRATYIAAWPDPLLLEGVLAKLCRTKAIDTVSLPEGIRLRQRGRDAFIFNYSREPVDLRAINGLCRLGRLEYGRWTLAPGGVAVLRSEA